MNHHLTFLMKYPGIKCNVLHIFCTADTRLHIMRCKSNNRCVHRCVVMWNRTCTGLQDRTGVARVSIMLGTFWCKLQMMTKSACLYTNKRQFFVHSPCPAHSVLTKTNSHMQLHKNILLGSVPVTIECDNDVTTATIATTTNKKHTMPSDLFHFQCLSSLPTLCIWPGFCPKICFSTLLFSIFHACCFNLFQ